MDNTTEIKKKRACSWIMGNAVTMTIGTDSNNTNSAYSVETRFVSY